MRVILLLLVTTMLTACTSFFFYPTKQWVGTPTHLGLEYQDLQFYTEDRTLLSAWLLEVPADKEVKGTVFFLHGNAQNISYHVLNVAWLPEQGYQVFILDYRGYGKSEGETTLPGMFADIRAGFDVMLNRPGVRDKPVFVLGQSLGASLAAYWFSIDEVRKAQLQGVVLDAAFASYADMAQSAANGSWLTWGFQYPIRWLVDNDYSAGPVIKQMAPTPLLFFHSSEDQVVSFEQGKALYDLALEPKELVKISGPHTATFNFPKYRETLLAFMQIHGRSG